MARTREKAKRKISLQPEPEPEDWCFDCKDGGQLVVCDKRNCGKVYHPDCVEKDESFFDNVKYWSCGRHVCSKCKKDPKFCCIGCPIAVCKKCFSASEFTLVRDVKGLCVDCLEIVQIIEQNLEHDSEGNKISLDDKETYEALFKEYWENVVKVKEGLTSDDLSAALPINRKRKNSVLQTSCSESEDDDLSAALPNNRKGRKGKNSALHTSCSESEDDDLSTAPPSNRKGKNSVLHTSCSESEDVSKSNEDYRGSKQRPTKRKRYNSIEFVGWASKPLFSFLASIDKYRIQPLTHWRVRSLICDYIKKKNLYHPKDKRKFIPDENLLPIFRKEVMSKDKIDSLLELHFSKGLYDLAGDKNNDQNKNGSTDKHINAQTCKESDLSGLLDKPLMKKGDLLIKPSCFASIRDSNIKLIYLKQSLVLELSKQPESFVSKVVGTFVRAKINFDDQKQRKSYQLVKVLGVASDETTGGILLQVSFTPKAIPISELSDEDFTEQECKDLGQKVKASLLPKLTVGELQEKAASLHEDITKHRIASRIAYLQYMIERANLRGRMKEKIAKLEEKEELEKPEKVEELLSRMPEVFPEFMEVKYDDSDEDKSETSR